MKYTIIATAITALAIAGLCGSSYAQEDTVSKLREISSLANENADLTRQLVTVSNACTRSFEAFDTDLVDECLAVFQNVKSHLESILSESSTDMNSIASSQYGGSYGYQSNYGDYSKYEVGPIS